MIADSDRIPDAETLSIRDDGIVRVLVLRVPPQPGDGRAFAYLALWHQRLDGEPARPARCLMIYLDNERGRQAAESLADHLAGMS